MHIVQVASEVAPFAKVGGLGDVVFGLSRELLREGHKVAIALPKYTSILTDGIVEKKSQSFPTLFKKEQFLSTVTKASFQNELSLLLFATSHPEKFYSREGIYGESDDVDRFVYFCRAFIDWLLTLKKLPDIVHIHDWPTALIALLIKQNKALKDIRVVFTIHNIAYQGITGKEALFSIDIEEALLKESAMGSQDVNILQLGCQYADAITTVSPTYAKEVLTNEGGKGLQEVLKNLQEKFYGIRNGIDNAYWDPSKDPFLYEAYTKDFVASKAVNKKSFCKEFGLTYTKEKPLVGCVTRLAAQKGLDLICHAIEQAINHNYQCVVVGTAPDPDDAIRFLKLSEKYATSKDVRIVLEHKECTAHKVFAASDMLIVPSLFEPCGLTQMIALRYATVPIVRKTGGLADTIFDIDYSEKPIFERNGFVFDFPDYIGIESALFRAVAVWKKEKNTWRELMNRVILEDYSWKIPTQEYLKVYRA